MPVDSLTIQDRLRLNAETICMQVGDGWRQEVAGLMGCQPDDVGAGPVSRHRDSEPIDESNFRVILRDLQSIDQRVAAERFRHWGVGWIEEIVVPVDNPAVIRRVEGWVSALQDYPVADDDDHVELEAEYATDSAGFDDNDDDGLAGIAADPDPDRPQVPGAVTSQAPPGERQVTHGSTSASVADRAVGVRAASARLDWQTSGVEAATPDTTKVTPPRGLAL